MSRPRKPFGANPPGRLPATMVKVLAAELSDQGRLARGKRYWADRAVIDIVVGHGSVTAEIQGSRAQPYVVTIEADPGTGVPGKRDVWLRCTCPDDSGVGNEACKHAVAALFALSDEVAIEPDLIERWRGGSGGLRRREQPHLALPDEPSSEPTPVQIARPAARPPEPGSPGDAARTNVIPIRRERPVTQPERVEVDPSADEIARLIAAPSGATAPELPDVSRIEHGGIRDRDLAVVLHDALDHLAIRWD